MSRSATSSSPAGGRLEGTAGADVEIDRRRKLRKVGGTGSSSAISGASRPSAPCGDWTAACRSIVTTSRRSWTGIALTSADASWK